MTDPVATSDPVVMERSSWPALEALDHEETVALIPLGAIEQHGPHLPLATDHLIAECLAVEIARRLQGPVVVAPVIAGGRSDHHVGFPGTVSLPADAFAGAIDAYLATLARLDIQRIVLFSAHGGNFGFMTEFAQTRAVVAYDDLDAYLRQMFLAAQLNGVEAPVTDVHAGGLETSLALHLFPELVDSNYASVAGYTAADEGWLERVMSEGVHSLSPSGVLGDPSLASPGLGSAIFDRLASHLVDWLVGRFHLQRSPGSTSAEDGGAIEIVRDRSVPSRPLSDVE